MRERVRSDDPVSRGWLVKEDHEIARLQAQVSSLSTEIAKIHGILALGMRSTDGEEDEGKGRAVSDAAWKCKKCRALLGFYDVQSDVMRIRYKDHIAFFRLGPGGFVQTICRGCGEINTEEWASAEEVAASQRARDPQVVRRPSR